MQQSCVRAQHIAHAHACHDAPACCRSCAVDRSLAPHYVAHKNKGVF